MMHFRFLLYTSMLYVFVLCAPARADGDTIYVPEDYTTIQAAINAASNGDEIRVGPGTYTGTGNAVIDSLGKDLFIHATGTIEETILDGEGARGVVVCSGGGSGFKLIGFTITGGNAPFGGGVKITDSGPSIWNCQVRNNSAVFAGGGIYISGTNSSPFFINCNLLDNSTTHPTVTTSGGGMYVSQASFMFAGGLIANNQSDLGAGVYLTDASLSFLGCVITDNGAAADGGGIYNDASTVVISDVRICGNEPNQIIGPWEDQDTGEEFLSFVSEDCVVHVPGDFGTIQEAVNVAVDGDEILLAPGTYSDLGSSVVDLQGKAITLRGTGTRQETIIDGEGQRRVIVCDSGEGPDTIIEGITVTGGSGTGSGGGIWVHNSSPTIRDCIVSNCSATNGGGIGGLNSNSTIIGCEVVGNFGSISGGMEFGQSDVTIQECTVMWNSAIDGGGGVSLGAGSYEVIDCKIMHNELTCVPDECSIGGGGMYVTSDHHATVNVSGTRFCGNIPDQTIGDWDDLGGNLLGEECSLSVPDTVSTIQEAIEFAVDKESILVAPGTYTGTGDWVINPLGKGISILATGAPEETIIDGQNVRRTVVCANNEGADTLLKGFTITGGSAVSGGGVYLDASHPTLQNCRVEYNTAQFGAGIFANDSGAEFLHCDIAHNTATSSAYGGGIYIEGETSPSLMHCRILSNNATYGAGMACIESNVDVTSCVIAKNTAVIGGGMYNNQCLPVLVDTSFCGNLDDYNNHINGPWSDGGGNTFDDVCPGACIYDFSGDGLVGGPEIVLLISVWNTDDAAADVDDDGIVGLTDLLLVLANWGACP